MSEIEGYNIKQVASEIKLTDIENNATETKKKDIKALFESDDENFSTQEIADTFNKIDKDKDGQVTDSEISEYVNNETSISQDKKAEYITFLKNMAKKNMELINNNDNVGTMRYTVQLGEEYEDIIKNVLKQQGIDSPTEEQIKNAMAQFESDNPDAVKTTKSGKKYLLVGAEVNVRANTSREHDENKIFNKNNSEEQINLYKAKYGNSDEDIESGEDSYNYDDVQDISIDVSSLSEDDYGDYKKEKVDEKITKAQNIINSLKDASLIKKISRNGNQVTISLKDNSDVIITYDRNNNISTISVNIDGEVNGHKYADLEFLAEGGLKINMDNDNKHDLTLNNDDLYDFDAIKAIVQPHDKKMSQYMSLGLRDTDYTGWYYSDKEKMHYQYDESSQKFVKNPVVKQINSAGAIIYYDKKEQIKRLDLRETLNKDYYYSESEKMHYKWDGKKFEKDPRVKQANDEKNKYYPKEKQITDLNLRTTNDKSGKYYFSEKEKMHYEWTGETFEKRPKIRFVNSDGTITT